MTGSTQNRRIVLFLPNNWVANKRRWLGIPQIALILTALLKTRYDFSILDANGEDLSLEAARSRLSELDPAVILLSGLSVEYFNQYHVGLRVAREACPNAAIVFGGVYPTTLPDAALNDPNVDYIFIGHAEERIESFLDLLLKQNIEELTALPGIGYRRGEELRLNPLSTYIGDVKSLVQPDYSLIDLENYLIGRQKEYQFNSARRSISILSSYGCPYNCVFCATRTISGRKVAMRSAEAVLAEIDYLVREHGVEELIFVDDHFLMSRERVTTILKELINRNYGLTFKLASVTLWRLDREILTLLKQAGCTQITISVESGNPRVLKEVIHKPVKLESVRPLVALAREVGIDMGANFVIGFPGETWDEIRESIKFAEDCDFDITHFHLATPLPKTELFRICMEKGYLPPDFSFLNQAYFGFGKGFITTEDFTPFELEVLRAFEWDRINFKTEEKKQKVALLMMLSPEELDRHRAETRRKLGIHY
jgi:tRNA A37 methylthiotransferase MiaB